MAARNPAHVPRSSDMRTLIVGALLGFLAGTVSAALFGWWLSYPTTYYTLGWCTLTQAMDEYYVQPLPSLLAMPLGGSLIGAVPRRLGNRRSRDCTAQTHP
ncbi:hypothetical protein [Rhodococcus jostii]